MTKKILDIIAKIKMILKICLKFLNILSEEKVAVDTQPAKAETTCNCPDAECGHDKEK